ncbi:TetR family transcriptional regulator [Agromyces mariniharenae]|uniref:TetR/AcrR family transcriptional regulator n=1 Tax=Agromyces mariniharenae TaxID=2604423 RepID=A0A5S4UXA4_9MICO|nr:TetR family transcriptional regulator [Agromyces mariniharenae]TYL50299.1 TetR/AcrR family transcriptional regulator [Agromyces mariniharenae]
MEQREAPRRRGRPRGANPDDTKARILAAAAAEFGERGYEAASIRSIARRAHVDPRLVHHYFDDKSALVAEVVAVPLRPDRIVQSALDGPIDELGARLLRAVLAAWGNPSVRPAATAAMRSVIGQGPVARMLREFLRREIMLRLAARLGDAADAELRAELAASQVVGIIMVRHILAFEPVASMSDEEIVARVAPAIQFHLTGDHRMLDSAPTPAKNSAHDE